MIRRLAIQLARHILDRYEAWPPPTIKVVKQTVYVPAPPPEPKPGGAKPSRTATNALSKL